MEKEKITVAVTIDENYTQHLGVMLCSLFENNSECDFEIFVYTEGLSEFAQDRLFMLVDGYGHSLNIEAIDPKPICNFPFNYPHLTYATYFRLLLPKLLSVDISKVLYLDPDIVVMANILPLWNVCLDGYSHAAVNAGSKDSQARIGMALTSKYFNAGVLLINLHRWRDVDLVRETTQLVEHFYKDIESDQDVLNLIFENQWLPVSAKWNVVSTFVDFWMADDYMRVFTPAEKIDIQGAVKSPGIVHFTGAGAGKPWHYLCNRPFKAIYWQYLALTPWKNCQPEGYTLKNVLIKYTPRVVKDLLKKRKI